MHWDAAIPWQLGHLCDSYGVYVAVIRPMLPYWISGVGRIFQRGRGVKVRE